MIRPPAQWTGMLDFDKIEAWVALDMAEEDCATEVNRRLRAFRRSLFKIKKVRGHGDTVVPSSYLSSAPAASTHRSNPRVSSNHFVQVQDKCPERFHGQRPRAHRVW